MRIILTRSDINRAIGGSRYCPIALAIRRQVSTTSVFVLPGHCLVNNRAFKLSKAAAKFVNDYDGGRKVEPATFILKRM